MSVTVTARRSDQKYRWQVQCGFEDGPICESHEDAIKSWHAHGDGFCEAAKAFFDRLEKIDDEDERHKAICEQLDANPHGHDPYTCERGAFIETWVHWENPLRGKTSTNNADAAMNATMADHLDELHQRFKDGVSMTNTHAYAVFDALDIKETPLTDSEGLITVNDELVYEFSVATSEYNGYASVEDAWNPVTRELNEGFVARTTPRMPYSGTMSAQDLLRLCEKYPERYGHDHGTLTEEFKGAHGATIIATGRPPGYIDRKVNELSDLAVFAAAIGGCISWS